jgi:phosphotransferase system HPr (HPr) family protein
LGKELASPIGICYGLTAMEETVNNSAMRKVIVINPAGLHARPSLAVSQTVRASQSKVEIHTPGQTVNAADVLQLLSLGASRGTELTLSAAGPDAEQVLDALAQQFADGFGLCSGAE